MSTFDVRTRDSDTVTNIVFADDKDCSRAFAYYIDRHGSDDTLVCINDHQEDFIIVTSAEHARDLMKALDKAIELGWLK